MHSIRLRTLLVSSLALLLPMGPSHGAQNGAPVILVGAGDGGGLARELRVTDGSEVASGTPYGPAFAGGVRVAVGDVNGDGVPDRIVGSGAGAGQIHVYSGRDVSVLASVFPFGPAHSGGVYVAAGDVDADGRADIIAGSGTGGGRVAVLSGADRHEIASGFPFSPLYAGGVTVAAGDVNGDGRADIIAGTAVGGAVRVVSAVGASLLASGFPYGPLFTGGVHVAAGDVNGDGRVDVITAPRSLGGLVRVFSGLDITVLAELRAVPGRRRRHRGRRRRQRRRTRRHRDRLGTRHAAERTHLRPTRPAIARRVLRFRSDIHGRRLRRDREQRDQLPCASRTRPPAFSRPGSPAPSTSRPTAARGR